VKFDGYRMQVRGADHHTQWRSRNGNDWTIRFSDIAPNFDASRFDIPQERRRHKALQLSYPWSNADLVLRRKVDS
jgi:hypothetical protein